jgi:hypothetical protein
MKSGSSSPKETQKQQQAVNPVESRVLARLKQELSFISSYKNVE